MREEYVPALDSYLRHFPRRLGSRLRLELLGPEAALQAVQRSAEQAGVVFEAEAAQALIDNLRLVREQSLDGTFVSALGPNVEPVQLQVVCFQLWSSRSDPDRISMADFARLGGVDQALETYYDERVFQTARATDTREDDIREWIE